jgi:hypothetical protein
MKRIPGFSNYFITDDGSIISYRKQGQVRKLKPFLNKGYLCITLQCDNGESKHVSIHRLMWITYNGDIPCDMNIDHIDHDRLNNVLSNLRLLTPQQNKWNTEARGCSYVSKSDCWKAEITISYKKILLGTWETESEAHQAYVDAKYFYHTLPGDDPNYIQKVWSFDIVNNLAAEKIMKKMKSEQEREQNHIDGRKTKPKKVYQPKTNRVLSDETKRKMSEAALRNRGNPDRRKR